MSSRRGGINGRPIRWVVRSLPLFMVPVLSLLLQWPLVTTILSLITSLILVLLYLQRGLISLRAPWTWRIFIVWIIQLSLVKTVELLVYHTIPNEALGGPIGEGPELDHQQRVKAEDELINNGFLAAPPKNIGINDAAGDASAAAGGGDTLTYSIVLPCANEGEFMVKTARSVYESTPNLHEIIVVDDGSSPPLRTLVTDDEVELWKLKFIRHEHFTGLINAKSVGGWQATGDIITFLDCHVKPDIHWTEPISKYISENPKTVVVPTVTSLDPNTWEETRSVAGTTRCCKLTWNVDFPWYNAEDTRVPIMIGGLLAMHRNMWEYTGGYDSGMVGWGGENIDQSLRIHLCGGEIMHALDSYVAHMWRLEGDEKTKAKYTLPSGSLMRNRYRAALSWFDEFVAKAEEQSEFLYWGNGGDKPDVSNVLEIKKKNHCRHFSYFLKKFKFLYEDAGMLPDKVFHLRARYDDGTQRCLELRDKHRLVMNKCSSNNRLQLWHGSNYDAPHSFKCCQGYRSWNSGICLAVTGARLSPTTCVDDGTSPIQTLHINDDGVMLTAITDGDSSVMLRGGQGGNNNNNNLKCVVPPPPVTDDNGEYDDEVEKVSLNGCMVNTPSEVTKSSQRFTMIPITDDAASSDDHGGNGSVMLLQTDSPKQGQQKTGSLSCLSASSSTDGSPPSLRVAECDASDKKQQWEWIHKIQIRNVALQQCLDAADGNTPILYTCYGEEEYNIGQQFIYDKDRGTLMNAKTYKCIDLHTESQHDLIESPPFIQTSAQCHQQPQQGEHPSVVWDEYLPFVPLETRLYAASSSSPAAAAAATDHNNDDDTP